MPAKWCYSCEQEKDVEDFAENRVWADGRNSMCKACKKTYNAAYYATKDRHNPGRIARRKRAQQERAKWSIST